MLALSRAVSQSGRPDYVTLASIIIGVLVAAKNVVSQCGIFYSLRRRVADIDLPQVYKERVGSGANAHTNNNVYGLEADELVKAMLVDDLEDPAAAASVYERIGIQPSEFDRNQYLCWSQEYRGGLECQRDLAWTTCKFLTVVGIYVMLVARAVFYTTMAVVVCEQGLYYFGAGCVQLPQTPWNHRILPHVINLALTYHLELLGRLKLDARLK